MTALKGKIETTYANESPTTGKKYVSVVISGVKYNCFDQNIWDKLTQGADFEGEYEEKNGWKNIVSVGTGPKPVQELRFGVRQPQQSYQPKPFSAEKEKTMRRMNALNNSVSLLKTLQDMGVKLDTEPDKIEQTLQLVKSIAKDMLTWINEEG